LAAELLLCGQRKAAGGESIAMYTPSDASELPIFLNSSIATDKADSLNNHAFLETVFGVDASFDGCDCECWFVRFWC
jgi:hypothetical protein